MNRIVHGDAYEEALLDAERRFGSAGGRMLRNGLAAAGRCPRCPGCRSARAAQPGAESLSVQPEALAAICCFSREPLYRKASWRIAPGCGGRLGSPIW